MVFYVIFWTTYLPFVPRRRSRFPSLRSLQAARAKMPVRRNDLWPSYLAE